MLYNDYDIYLSLLANSIINNDMEKAQFWQAVARKYKKIILKTPIKKLQALQNEYFKFNNYIFN